MKYGKIYVLTDGCMWEINKQTGNEHPHAVEIMDLETGAVRYIKSGSRIAFIEGQISDYRTQKSYNSQTDYAEKYSKEVSANGQGNDDARGGAKSKRQTKRKGKTT